MRYLRRLPIFVSLFTAAVVILGILGIPQPVKAFTGADFNSGRIIDDFVFYKNQPTMSVGEIQAFLNSKVPTCDTWHTGSGGNNPPFTCLKDYREVTTAGKPVESGLCYGWGGGDMSAAEIIYHVSQSCGVNAKALIVLLQKEQGLITDTWPWAIQYRSATGYGCPDTAACDSAYYGFFNQVYNAARQFKRYARDANLFNYRVGVTSYVLFNPNAACGGSNIFMSNKATAALYNYTPYQPNAAALNNLYGTGDSCSAYGNRNFWRLWRDWFGVTYANDTDVAHPNGTLITDGIGVYLVNNGQRSWIKSPAVFESYHYDWSKIKPVTTGDLALPWGPQIDVLGPGTVFRTDNSPTYIMDYDTGGVLKKRLTTNYVLEQLGYTGRDVVYVPPSDVPSATFSTVLTTPQHPSGTIVLFYGIPTVYLVDKGQLKPIQNELSFDTNGYKMINLKGGTQYDSWLPIGSPLQARIGTMVFDGQGIALIDYDGTGIMKRPVGPWDCYADRLHYTTRDWISGYQAQQLPVRVGPTFSC